MANRRAAQAPTEQTFGTFTKGDREVVAYSRKRAVELRFDGWADKDSGTSSPPAEQTPEP